MTERLPVMPEGESRYGGWLGWLLLVPMLGVGYGVWRYELLVGVRADYVRLLWMIVAAMAAMATLAWLALGRRAGATAAPSALVILVLAGFVYYAGAGAAMAASLLALAGIAVGGLIDSGLRASAWSRFLAGLAVISAVVGWLLPFPIHDSRLYLVVVGVLLLLRHRQVMEQLRSAAAGWSEISQSHAAWLCAAIVMVGIASIGLWMPSWNYDDNAGHLILPNQLLSVGYYRMDVSSQIGAVTPWANNVLHGIAALVSGEESRGALNLLWLLLGTSGAYRVAVSIGGSRASALTAAAVYASHPLTSYFASTMQVDGPVAAVLMHLAADLVNGKGRLASPWTTGAMVGLLAGLKATNVFFVFLPIAWWAWKSVRNREPVPLLAFLTIAAAVGGASYAYAIWVTGNPLLPFYNAVFQSPFMSLTNLQDARWHTGVEWRAIWDITFSSSRFGEVYPGAAGIALLVTLPGLAVEIARGGGGRWLALWLLVAGTVMFWQIQYLRYLFPAIAVLSTVGIVGLSRYMDNRMLATVATVLVAVNSLLLPATSWVAKDNPWGRLLSEGVSAKAEIQRAVIPEKALLGRLYAHSPKACVLLTDQKAPFVGAFRGNANAMGWYDPRLQKAHLWADGDASGRQWQQILRSVGASHLVMRHQTETPLSRAVLAIGYERVDTEGGLELWASASVEKRRCDGRFLQQRDQALRMFHLWKRH